MNVTWQLEITLVAKYKIQLPSRLFHINLLNNRSSITQKLQYPLKVVM